MASVSDIDALCHQASRALRQQDYDKAIELFHKALESDPDCVAAHRGLGTVFFHTQEYEAAVQHFTRWMQIKPMEAKPYINLGAVYNRMGNYPKAAEVLYRGIQKDAKSYEGYYNLGIAHRHLDRLGMAMNAYREAIRINPKMADAHQNLANVYLKMGNHRKAVEHFRQALEISPNFARAQRGLAKAEKAAAEAPENANPFGRLVDQEALEEQADTTQFRELSLKERFDDRRAIQRLTETIQALAHEWLDHLHNVMGPTLLALGREIGQEQPASLSTVYESLCNAMTRNREMRERLSRSLDQLRSHEESFQSDANP